MLERDAAQLDALRAIPGVRRIEQCQPSDISRRIALGGIDVVIADVGTLRSMAMPQSSGGSALPIRVALVSTDAEAMLAFTAGASACVHPSTAERLGSVIRHLTRLVELHRLAALRGHVERAMRENGEQEAGDAVTALPAAPMQPDRLWIRAGNGAAICLLLQNVEYMRAFGNHVTIWTDDRAHRTRATLQSVLSQLSASTFRQIHRSTIVNLVRVDHAVRDRQGSGTVIMRSGLRLRVSRRFWTGLVSALGDRADGHVASRAGGLPLRAREGRV